jgi:hypothetical protein
MKGSGTCCTEPLPSVPVVCMDMTAGTLCTQGSALTPPLHPSLPQLTPSLTQ